MSNAPAARQKQTAAFLPALATRCKCSARGSAKTGAYRSVQFSNPRAFSLGRGNWLSFVVRRGGAREIAQRVNNPFTRRILFSGNPRGSQMEPSVAFISRQRFSREYVIIVIRGTSAHDLYTHTHTIYTVFYIDITFITIRKEKLFFYSNARISSLNKLYSRSHFYILRSASAPFIEIPCAAIISSASCEY